MWWASSPTARCACSTCGARARSGRRASVALLEVDPDFGPHGNGHAALAARFEADVARRRQCRFRARGQHPVSGHLDVLDRALFRHPDPHIDALTDALLEL